MIWLLHLLLQILKWIGIILFALLLLILLTVLLVLLVPIRYRIQGSYYEKVHVKAKVTWLCSLVTVLFGMEDQKTDLRIKVLGIPVVGGKKKEKRNPAKKKKTNQNKSESSVESTEGMPEETSHESVLPPEDITSTVPEEKPETVKKEKKKVKTKEKPPKKKDPSAKEKKKTDLDALKQKAIFLKEQWGDEGNRALLRSVLFRIKKILLHLLPTKLSLKIHFGLDNPATMGQILSILAVLYPIYGDSVQIQPEMEEKIIEGEGFIKGRIRLIVFVYAAIRILLNPQVRILIRRFKRQNGERS